MLIWVISVASVVFGILAVVSLMALIIVGAIKLGEYDWGKYCIFWAIVTASSFLLSILFGYLHDILL